MVICIGVGLRLDITLQMWRVSKSCAAFNPSNAGIFPLKILKKLFLLNIRLREIVKKICHSYQAVLVRKTVLYSKGSSDKLRNEKILTIFPRPINRNSTDSNPCILKVSDPLQHIPQFMDEA